MDHDGFCGFHSVAWSLNDQLGTKMAGKAVADAFVYATKKAKSQHLRDIAAAVKKFSLGANRAAWLQLDDCK